MQIQSYSSSRYHRSSEEFRVMLNQQVDRWASMLKTTAISVD
jgi:hypothetical protein